MVGATTEKAVLVAPDQNQLSLPRRVFERERQIEQLEQQVADLQRRMADIEAQLRRTRNG
jgi:septal ring factor EnvC (AmiA/AmiB activator)